MDSTTGRREEETDGQREAVNMIREVDDTNVHSICEGLPMLYWIGSVPTVKYAHIVAIMLIIK